MTYNKKDYWLATMRLKSENEQLEAKMEYLERERDRLTAEIATARTRITTARTGHQEKHEGMSNHTIDREAHLDKLADEVIRLLNNEPDEFYCGLQANRPFGFSGRWSIARSVCGIVGLEPAGNCDGEAVFTDEQIAYGEDLLDEVPNHIRKRWQEFRTGKAEHAG